METRASRRAQRYVRKRGGTLFVWRDEDGMVRYATSRPNNIDFRRVHAPGFSLHIDKRAVVGDSIAVERSPLPPWRLLISFKSQSHGGGDTGGAW